MKKFIKTFALTNLCIVYKLINLKGKELLCFKIANCFNTQLLSLTQKYMYRGLSAQCVTKSGFKWKFMNLGQELLKPPWHFHFWGWLKCYVMTPIHSQGRSVTWMMIPLVLEHNKFHPPLHQMSVNFNLLKCNLIS